MRTCLISTVTNSYVPGLLFFIKTFKLHNPIDRDYVVLEVEPLTLAHKEAILSLYPRVTFIPIASADYHYDTLTHTFRHWPYNVFNRFDIFLREEYDRLFFFDVDLVVKGSLEELFNCTAPFAAAPITKTIDHDVPTPFDAGVMVIGKQFITPQVRSELIDLSLTKKWSSDEPVLNQYFYPYLTLLDPIYNTLTTHLTLPKFKQAKIVQYVGERKLWHGATVASAYDQFVRETSEHAALTSLLTLYKNCR